MKRMLIIGALIVLILTVALSGCGGSSPNQHEFTADANTITLWHFNEASGTTVADSSTSGNYSLTLASNNGSGAPAFTASGHNGFGDCLSLDSVKQQYAYNSSNMTFTNKNISVEFWVKFSSLATDEPPLVKFTTGGFAIFISKIMSSTGIIHWMFMNEAEDDWNSFSSNISSALTADTWHYVACTYDHTSDTAVIYIDGVPDKTLNPTKGFDYMLGYPHIGSSPTGTFWFTGLIDEMRISNSARTAAEIQNYYNQAIQP